MCLWDNENHYWHWYVLDYPFNMKCYLFLFEILPIDIHNNVIKVPRVLYATYYSVLTFLTINTSRKFHLDQKCSFLLIMCELRTYLGHHFNWMPIILFDIHIMCYVRYDILPNWHNLYWLIKIILCNISQPSFHLKWNDSTIGIRKEQHRHDDICTYADTN